LEFLLTPYVFPGGGYFEFDSPTELFIYVILVMGWVYLILVIIYHLLVQKLSLFNRKKWLKVVLLVAVAFTITFIEFIFDGFNSKKVSEELAFADNMLILMLTGIAFYQIHKWMFKQDISMGE
jgi:4-amino-4-deoxy-L-arabinose transferase-like glycosyltransferase